MEVGSVASVGTCSLVAEVAVLDFIVEVTQHSDSFRLTARHQVLDANDQHVCYAEADLWVVVY